MMCKKIWKRIFIIVICIMIFTFLPSGKLSINAAQTINNEGIIASGNYETDVRVAKKSGLCKASDGKWYYYKNDKVDTTYTGMAKNQYGWWYMKNGKLDTSYRGLAKNNYGTWYMKDGKLDTSLTSMLKIENSNWMYIKNGKFQENHTGLVMYGGKWLEIGPNYTSTTTQSDGWLYIKNGQLDTNYVGMAKAGNSWSYVKDGTLDTSYTGMAKNQYGWWYITNGKLDKSYIGIAQNDYGVWYIKNGKLYSNYSGTLVLNDVKYTIKKGKVQETVMYAKSQVNVRSGASTNYEQIGFLRYGRKTRVIGTSQKTGWYQIRYMDKIGFVSNKYVQKERIQQTSSSISTSVQNILNKAKLNPNRSNFEPLNKEIDIVFAEVISNDMTTYEKVKACYDYLIDYCSYGNNDARYDYVEYLFSEYYGEVSAYGMLKGKIGVCSDYSEAFAMLMRAIGLNCYTVDGQTAKSGGGYTGHTWCEMNINGTIYVFDPQVEDNIAKGGEVYYYRFCKKYEEVPTKYIKYE